MPDTVVIFAPVPIITVTVEDRAGAGRARPRRRAAVWQSRMVCSLGVPVVLCSALGGETGNVIGHLLPTGGWGCGTEGLLLGMQRKWLSVR